RQLRQFRSKGVRPSATTGEVARLPDDNIGLFAITNPNGTVAVGGKTTATELFLLPSIPSRSHSTLTRAIGILPGDITLTLIILTMGRSTATTICHRTKSSQTSRSNCTTRVIIRARSTVFLARIPRRQSQITRPTTGYQSRRRLTNRPLSHWDWFSKTASQQS